MPYRHPTDDGLQAKSVPQPRADLPPETPADEHPQLHLQLLDAIRPLRRVARQRLQNTDWADDAVAETLLAALERPPLFREPARVRAWLMGILRHKLTDQLRLGLREVTEPHGDGDDSVLDRVEAPGVDPLADACRTQFLQHVSRELGSLPTVQAQAFLLRVAHDWSTEEACDVLQVSPGHLAVLVHRARRRLQQGLVEHRV
jgi:RNA polymerase sigma-70 factor (ECF subfamily)